MRKRAFRRGLIHKTNAGVYIVRVLVDLVKQVFLRVNNPTSIRLLPPADGKRIPRFKS